MTPWQKRFILFILVADLFALVYFGGNFIATGSFLSHEAEDLPIVVAGVSKDGVAPKIQAKSEPVFDLASYVANPDKGKKVAAKCKACHTFNKGGKHRTGPNMWNIFNAKSAAHDFTYSSAMAEKNITWTEENLHTFLEAPKKYIKGTKMQFNGIKKPADRANLIAWLKTLQ